ncbi:MAG: phosphoglycerate mutase family protein [gamma proteobacterium symbiont of Bathyaustriella thionipta]|nr:phosphoglycerate mutase family protein [gamma proteobacterium symbiont of Bathyaustriella thionipta]MCU7950466.1 phosphoglycerate mutase family protein [gamma proteobacterium symbiont of Bathyaustriella thionipta]MCU7953274.1 phosphoglycerate mutase family protein [gamma proteobacterium symbiont of Bathyaustriella thionipta]MCU7957256.1 phosphoglycerate mutase family protein [gamma proteobacterium symbiont of Bathyaustriella thionipta]MCU7966526.1 phosphoglycerate mutase family protein [gamm
MARIIAALIRHGDYHQLENTPSAWQPYPLTEAGKSHARAAAENLRNTLIKEKWLLHPVCDSSQLLRAWQTAEIICESLSNHKVLTNKTFHNTNQVNAINIDSFDALAERSVGSAANLSISQIEEIINTDPRFDSLPKDWKSNSRFCLPLQGAESLIDSGKRVANHLLKKMSELQTSVKHPTLKLFVGHGAAFRHAAYHLGVLEFKQIAELSMFHGQPVFIERLEDGSWVHLFGEWKVRKKKSQYTD